MIAAYPVVKNWSLNQVSDRNIDMITNLGNYKLGRTWLGNWTVYKEIAGTRPWDITSRWVRCKTHADWENAFKALFDMTWSTASPQTLVTARGSKNYGK